MYVNAIIGLAIIILSLISGNVASLRFANRVDTINQMITGLKLLEAAITYTYDPIPKAMKNVSGKVPGVVRTFFCEVSESLSGEYSGELSDIWKDKADAVLSRSALTQKEIQIIRDFGMNFGNSDLQGQKSLFSHTYSLLQMQLEEAVDDKKQKTKLCRSIYGALGFFIVILLI